MIINVIWIVIFCIFAFGSIGDPEFCYIPENNFTGGTPDIAVTYLPYVDAPNWATKFRAWYIAGVILGIANVIIYTADLLAKLK